jgi:hypothetical protein
MRIFLNNRGFSIVQGMILAGVVAGSSLVATKMLTDQKKAQKGAETRDLVEDLHQSIYTILQARPNCKQTLISNQLNGSGGGPNLADSSNNSLPFNLTRISTNVSGTIDHIFRAYSALDPVVYMNNNVLITRMTLLPQTDPLSAKRTLEIFYERLNPDPAKRTKVGYGAKNIRKTIVLRIQKDPNTPNELEGCYALTNDNSTSANAINGQASSEGGNDLSKKMCLDMNTTSGKKAFVWDEENSICKPNASCEAGYIYTGIDSIGHVKCRRIEEWMDMNRILDNTPPPTSCPTQYKFEVYYDSVAQHNKVRVICD